ncbi:MAG: response regulator transcription factor [Clostridia bacterium]|nr:response regulator transcription factor [Clostridia bacterium]
MNNNQITVLVVDDDKNICELIRLYMVKEGFRVLLAYDGNTALDIIKSREPDIVVLDIMLPEMDGYQVLTKMRQFTNIPVILLSAKGEVTDKVIGLELGADDYMTKPFETKELVARVRARIRGKENSYEEECKPVNIVNLPNLCVNKENYTATIHGKQVEMPPRELELLFFLASNPNKVFTREQLLEKVWGFEFYGDSRTVDVHVKRVREKLKPDNDVWSLRTVWAVGYKFELKV